MRKLIPEIIVETEDYVAVSKPSGMLTLPDRHDEELLSLRGWMQQRYGKIWVVHRLDKDTSGLIIFARNEVAHKYLSKLFEDRVVRKIYQGIVQGQPLESQGNIDAPLAEHPVKNGTMVVNKKGKESLTEYKTVNSWQRYSLLEFNLHTGRTHQIRVHCKYLGHPILCDPFYGDPNPILLSSFKKKFKLNRNAEFETPIFARLALHSFQLGFADMSGNEIVLEAPLPKDFRAFIQQLEKANR